MFLILYGKLRHIYSDFKSSTISKIVGLMAVSRIRVFVRSPWEVDNVFNIVPGLQPSAEIVVCSTGLQRCIDV